MTAKSRMKLGMTLPIGVGALGDGKPVAWTTLREIAKRGEEIGFDSVMLPDHLIFRRSPPGDVMMVDMPEGKSRGIWEAWSILSAVAEATRRVHLGTLVACTGFRNPALLAKMADAVEEISNGRLILGIGAGWNEEEYRTYGFPYPPAKVRIAQLAEAIELIRRMWAGGPVDYRGEHYAIAGAHCEPRPRPIPPVMVGGSGEKFLLRVVARHADWWNYVWKGPEAYAHKQEVLKAHCREARRDYDAIQQVVRVGILIADSERDVARLKAAPWIRSLDDIQLVGTPAQVTEALLGIVAQGAHRLTVNFADVPRPEGTWLFSAAVLPHLAGGA